MGELSPRSPAQRAAAYQAVFEVRPPAAGLRFTEEANRSRVYRRSTAPGA